MGTRRDIGTDVLGRLGVCRIHITRAALLPSALKQQNKRSSSKSEVCVSYIYYVSAHIEAVFELLEGFFKIWSKDRWIVKKEFYRFFTSAGLKK